MRENYVNINRRSRNGRRTWRYTSLCCNDRYCILSYAVPSAEEAAEEDKGNADQLAVGDSVLTTSGFYGVVIDITDDTVIVEFGNNKNCRIPMQKAAITQLEKPEV